MGSRAELVLEESRATEKFRLSFVLPRSGVDGTAYWNEGLFCGNLLESKITKQVIEHFPSYVPVFFMLAPKKVPLLRDSGALEWLGHQLGF